MASKLGGKVFTFGEWLAALPEMSAVEFTHRCRSDFAFCGSNLLPQDQKAEFESFRKSWRARFGTLGVGELDGVRGKTSLEDLGWYALSAAAVLVLLKENPAEYAFILEREVKVIMADWEKYFPGRGADATVLARICGHPRGSYVSEVSRGPHGTHWTIEHWYNGNMGWELAETGIFAQFRISISGPGTLPFQRACRLLEWFNNAPSSTDTLLAALQWVFAAGYDNALKAADDVLSGRKGETIASARQKVRAALV